MEKNKTTVTNYSSNKSKYSYSSTTESFLDAFMGQKIVKPIVNFLPYGLPANIITIISTSLVLFSFLIALQCQNDNYKLWFLIPVFVCIYLIGDCVDGEQARRTKTGSPLGEFLDHFLDTFVSGQLMISLLVVYNVNRPTLIYTVLCIGYITQSIAFWERYQTGHMFFGKFGSTESILTLTLILTLGGFEKIRNFAALKLSEIDFFKTHLSQKLSFIYGFSIIEIVFIILVICAIGNIIWTIFRAKRISIRFFLFMLFMGFVTFEMIHINDMLDCFSLFIIALYAIGYVQSLLYAIVSKKKDPVPDFLFPTALLVLYFMNVQIPNLSKILFVYVSVEVVIKAFIFIYKNRKYWVWKNPKVEA